MHFDIGDILLIKDDRKSLADNLIKGVGGGNFSHTACVTETNKEVFEMHCPKGAIVRPLSDYFNSRYTVLVAHHKHMTGAQRIALKRYLLNIVNRKVKYDYRGVMGHALKFPDKINNKERMYCSEAIGFAFFSVLDYRFAGLNPSVQAPKDQGFDVISKQHIWENEYISREFSF